MIKQLQKKYALSEQGAMDLVKGCLACVFQHITFMFPVGLLYSLVGDLLGGGIPAGKTAFYAAGCAVCVGLILLSTYLQYNATYFATYVESGVRRITLAEQLRKIPLSFFGKKDLADLTSTIMADCTFLEQSFSHFIPELAGSIISTVLISISLLCFDWRMALAALWVLPLSFAIVGGSAGVQERLNQKTMDAKMTCADGIQECIETAQDLKANNAERVSARAGAKDPGGGAPEHHQRIWGGGFCGQRLPHPETGHRHRGPGGFCPAAAGDAGCAHLFPVPAGGIPAV